MLKQFDLRPDDVTNGTWWLKKKSKFVIKAENKTGGDHESCLRSNDFRCCQRFTDPRSSYG